MRIVKRVIGLVVLAAVLAVLGGGGWVVYGKIAEAMEDPAESDGWGRGGAVAVEVAPIEYGPIRQVRTFTGSLRARSEFELAPRIGGWLEALAVDVGDRVERGQVVARLDDEEHQQQVDQADAELRVAQATLEERRSALDNAERELRRVRRLRDQRIASESELDAAESQFEAEQAAVRVAEAQVSQREASLRAARVRLSYTQVRASWSEGGGETRVVGERYTDEGSTVAANEPLLLLLDNRVLRAIIHVTERDYANLALGQTATITSASHPERAFEGELLRMTPRFVEGSRQARVEIGVDNPEELLKPGMFVRVSLELGRAEEATIVPRQALVDREGRVGVFVVDEDEGLARFVPLALGIREGARVQVLEPELTGRVVTLGQHLLDDESAVVLPAGSDGTDGADAAEALAGSGEEGAEP